ncbi:MULTISPECIES: hypothetical protein [Cysteiniphilum]|uniref:hypothetical protein n=1 Tax=Cysteiniphilum TaxID=2056696 RepID=UPI0017846ECF|nr:MULTISPECIES: hypothetical protein [Cysteiniphilum]
MTTRNTPKKARKHALKSVLLLTLGMSGCGGSGSDAITPASENGRKSYNMVSTSLTNTMKIIPFDYEDQVDVVVESSQRIGVAALATPWQYRVTGDLEAVSITKDGNKLRIKNTNTTGTNQQCRIGITVAGEEVSSFKFISLADKPYDYLIKSSSGDTNYFLVVDPLYQLEADLQQSLEKSLYLGIASTLKQSNQANQSRLNNTVEAYLTSQHFNHFIDFDDNASKQQRHQLIQYLANETGIANISSELDTFMNHYDIKYKTLKFTTNAPLRLDKTFHRDIYFSDQLNITTDISHQSPDFIIGTYEHNSNPTKYFLIQPHDSNNMVLEDVIEHYKDSSDHSTTSHNPSLAGASYITSSLNTPNPSTSNDHTALSYDTVNYGHRKASEDSNHVSDINQIDTDSLHALSNNSDINIQNTEINHIDPSRYHTPRSSETNNSNINMQNADINQIDTSQYRTPRSSETSISNNITPQNNQLDSMISATSNTQATTTNIPDIPKTLNTTNKIPSIPNIPNIPNIPSTQANTNIPKIPNIPNISNTANIPKIPNISNNQNNADINQPKANLNNNNQTVNIISKAFIDVISKGGNYAFIKNAKGFYENRTINFEEMLKASFFKGLRDALHQTSTTDLPITKSVYYKLIDNLNLDSLNSFDNTRVFDKLVGAYMVLYKDSSITLPRMSEVGTNDATNLSSYYGVANMVLSIYNNFRITVNNTITDLGGINRLKFYDESKLAEYKRYVLLQMINKLPTASLSTMGIKLDTSKDNQNDRLFDIELAKFIIASNDENYLNSLKIKAEVNQSSQIDQEREIVKDIERNANILKNYLQRNLLEYIKDTALMTNWQNQLFDAIDKQSNDASKRQNLLILIDRNLKQGQENNANIFDFIKETMDQKIQALKFSELIQKLDKQSPFHDLANNVIQDYTDEKRTVTADRIKKGQITMTSLDDIKKQLNF